jgi:acetolactate decarboxylase
MRNIIVFSTLMLISYNLIAQTKTEIKIVGEMRNVMWKGQLYGNINLDTIANKEHLFGLGPVEYLSGELMIFDGKAYKSTVLTPTTMKVEETFITKAPFFGYANIEKWEEQNLPDSVKTLTQLETYINAISQRSKRPFFFKLEGEISSANIHIVNLPKGSKVSSPDEAHKGQTNYQLQNEIVDILGFFSTEHKAIFTHHDTFLHLHLITKDRSKMGHLEQVELKGTVKLFLPIY